MYKMCYYSTTIVINQTLDSSCPNDEEFDCSVAQLPDNLAKTRCTKHLPREHMYMYNGMHTHKGLLGLLRTQLPGHKGSKFFLWLYITTVDTAGRLPPPQRR